MATSFTSELRDATAYNPRLQNTSLSATDLSLAVNSFGTIGVNKVVAVLYNALTSPVTGTTTLSAYNGFRITASNSFNGKQIGLEYANRSVSLVTLVTSFGISTQQAISAADFTAVGPNTRAPITFSAELRDATAYNPQPLNATLSASNNSFAVNAFGSIGGKAVVAVLYNPVTSPDPGMVALTAFRGLRLNVSNTYNLQPIALEYADRSTTLITIVSSFGTSTQQSGFDGGSTVVSPNTRRLIALDMI